MIAVDYLKENFVFGIIAVVLLWEVLKFILKKIFRLVTFPIRKTLKLVFGNAKILNIELTSAVLILIGVVIYLIYFKG